jgi:pimeloyl-ACP methyl ester carboxylesterase
MDQTTFENALEEFRQHCSAENNVPDLTVSAGRAGAPIVVLIHGIGGNAQHWLDPTSIDVNDTWLFDLDSRPQGTGLASSLAYAPGSVMSWCKMLQREQITYITWSQTQPNDLIAYAVQDALAVLGGLRQHVFDAYEHDFVEFGGAVPSLILLCHSRGGLVARLALKQLGDAGVPHLRKVITLCTPHRGSYMPLLAVDYNDSLSNTISFSSLRAGLPAPISFVSEEIAGVLGDLANRVREAMLHSFGSLAQGAGFAELEPGSRMFQDLVQNEQPLPKVRYYGFGGSNPTFVHFYLCELNRAFHLLATADSFLVEQLSRIPGVRDRYGGLEEIDQGDSSVGLSRSQWPDAFGAPHQVFPLNHMQALIDPSLQQAALAIIQA